MKHVHAAAVSAVVLRMSDAYGFYDMYAWYDCINKGVNSPAPIFFALCNVTHTLYAIPLTKNGFTSQQSCMLPRGIIMDTVQL